MARWSRIVAAAVLGSLAGCGGSGGGGGPTLSVSPSQSTVTSGGPGVPFTATLTGSSNSVAWTLAGPGSITPASGTGTTYTPPATVASPTTATLTANAGAGLSASATITVNPPPAITVAGRVVDQSGRPVGDVAVIAGSSPPTVSDALGAFSVPGVTPPYDLVAYVSTPSKFAVVYKSLHRSDPTIITPFQFSSQSHGVLTGNVSGGDPVDTPGEKTAVAFGSPEASEGHSITTNPYVMSVYWWGPPTTSGTVHALQWNVNGNSVPTSYNGYGTASASVAGSGTTTRDVVMGPVSTAHVGGTITLPASYSVVGTNAFLNFLDGATVALGFSNSSATAFGWSVPSISGMTVRLSVSGFLAGVGFVTAHLSGVAPGTTNVAIDIPDPALPVTPAESGTGINTTTPFSWTPLTGGIYRIAFNGSGSDPTFWVWTDRTTATIPDLSTHGLGLPSGAAYQWQVLGLGPYASLDVLAGQSTIFPPTDFLYQSGCTRSFTTQ